MAGPDTFPQWKTERIGPGFVVRVQGRPWAEGSVPSLVSLAQAAGWAPMPGWAEAARARLHCLHLRRIRGCATGNVVAFHRAGAGHRGR